MQFFYGQLYNRRMSKKRKKKNKAKIQKRKEERERIQREKELERLRILQEKKENRSYRVEWIFPIIALLWIELVMKISASGGSSLSYLWVLLFSIAAGTFFNLLTGWIPKKSVKRFLRALVYFVIGVWFVVCYFVNDTFKVFYDLNTIFAGGKDAATGFTGQIVNMVFSVEGILHILLFLLPFLLYVIYFRKLDGLKRHTKKMNLVYLLTIVVAAGMELSLIQVTGNSHKLGQEYSYVTCVSEFGIIPSFGLDLMHLTSSSSFTIASVEDEMDPEEAIISEDPFREEYDSFVYYKNAVMDIDFATLQSVDTGTYQEIDAYVQSLTPSSENAYTGLFEGKNLIMISAEAFSGKIIDPELTPTLYRLATKGIQFTDYYQPASAGTTGGEYENLFGLLPTSGGSSFKLTAARNNYLTMGSQLDRLGYNGWAFHANSYTYYDRNLTHNNLGYSNGFMGYGNGLENVITYQWPESDLEMVQGTIDMYIEHEPFNVYYMSVSGHNPYSTGGNAMSKKNWDRVQNLNCSDTLKAYYAANLELEDALAYLVEKLEEKGILDDTVIVLGADHFPYGLDDDAALGSMTYLNELYGENVTTYLQRDQNTLIVYSGCLEEEEPIVVDTPTSSLDILPTLCNLFGVDWDSRLLVGRDVFSDSQPLVFNLNYDWKTDLGTYLSSTGVFTPNDGVTVSDTYVETMRTIVRNKISYCTNVLNSDYYTHLFGERTDPVTSPIAYSFP